MRIEERTLRIGFRIKRPSQREIGAPELLAFHPPLNGREPIPRDPLVVDQCLRLNHEALIFYSRLDPGAITPDRFVELVYTDLSRKTR